MSEVMRYYHYGRRTEEAYTYWIKDFIFFHHKRHPKDMGKSEVESYLSALAVKRNVAVSTQNQAFNALLFLYKSVLQLPFSNDIAATRSKRAPRLPVVLSQKEMSRLLHAMKGETLLMARVMYGGGLRLNEMLRLRVQDINFDYLTIHAGKRDYTSPLQT
ncbi:MAG: phage integrase N-terminal SAM-like domain-containing protein [Mariprofundaceae bacterium]